MREKGECLMDIVKKVEQLIEQKRHELTQISDQIWEYAETRFEEHKSAQLICDMLEKEEFTLRTHIASLETGFIGSYGHGYPIIAILGEYDALTGLSQKDKCAVADPVKKNGNGHGCGHNLLGVGSLAAALAVKEYLKEKNVPGTVRYYGCPAEESGYGKTYMVREGFFQDVDIAFSWHPATVNGVMHTSSNAVMQATFKFKGRSSHAAASPHLGRSALDAVELMNIGVNYMREHMIDEARVHYAITNSGGISPNVVQAEAEVMYLIRAPKPSQVKELYERVVKIAKGAALMTETQMEQEIQGACANLIPNQTMEQLMHKQMMQINLAEVKHEEIVFAKAIYESTSAEDKEAAKKQVGSLLDRALANHPVFNQIAPMSKNVSFMTGSTDVADVSWNVPTAQCVTATWAYATPFHTWQAVAQGKTEYAHDAMLLAGKAIAATAIEMIENQELISQAKQELEDRLEGESYECLVPSHIQPPNYSESEHEDYSMV